MVETDAYGESMFRKTIQFNKRFANIKCDSYFFCETEYNENILANHVIHLHCSTTYINVWNYDVLNSVYICGSYIVVVNLT